MRRGKEQGETRVAWPICCVTSLSLIRGCSPELWNRWPGSPLPFCFASASLAIALCAWLWLLEPGTPRLSLWPWLCSMEPQPLWPPTPFCFLWSIQHPGPVGIRTFSSSSSVSNTNLRWRQGGGFGKRGAKLMNVKVEVQAVGFASIPVTALLNLHP